MATTYQREHDKRRQGKAAKKKSIANYVLMIGAIVLVVGFSGYGMITVLGFGQEAASVQVSAPTQVEESDAANSSAIEVPVAPVDREARFLGPPSDPAGLSLAETGEVGQPTLVWFHADWCHVCQQIKPDVVNLGEEFEGKVKFIRLNVDHAESRDAVRRYGVRATPTFVLFDAQGQIRGQVPGWPGYQAITGAFAELLAGG